MRHSFKHVFKVHDVFSKNSLELAFVTHLKGVRYFLFSILFFHHAFLNIFDTFLSRHVACKLDLSKILLFTNDSLFICKFYSLYSKYFKNSFNVLLFSSAGEGHENILNQQTGEVSFLHFDDAKLEAQVDLHQMFCPGALIILKAVKVQIDLKFVMRCWFFYVIWNPSIGDLIMKISSKKTSF